jgi:hypothetical protein
LLGRVSFEATHRVRRTAKSELSISGGRDTRREVKGVDNADAIIGADVNMPPVILL